MQTKDIRKQFLEYFRSKGHLLVPSSPVLPHQDPTLLFTNAGMNQFKDIFLGKSTRDYKRAVTCQKCIRAGGKHNDLDNVGHTNRHLTFFEMLGNFSFGDYFKEQAIEFSWEVATKIFGFDESHIYPSVFETDEEAFNIWTKYVPASRITRFGEADNFWSMGETGPCGPSSELYYDRGEKYSTAKNPREDTSGERFLEFWNLVFMQYNRNKDGELESLPQKSIDTGAGLERIMSIIENTESVYETDILRGLIQAIEEESKIKYDVNDKNKAPAFRVIADHMRSLSFAIGDGVLPSNVDRGYVLRKILRRAVRYGKILGFEEPFLAKILPRLIDLMGDDYKELVTAQHKIAEILTREEVSFLKTLKIGGNILNQIIESSQKAHKISGADAFKLKDTYGLPLEEILLIAKDSALSVDIEEYEKLEQEAKIKSKAVKKEAIAVEKNLFEEFSTHNKPSIFIREERELFESRVIGLISKGEFVKALKDGEEGIVILQETPFYPEMGGQVGDTGILANNQAYFEVTDCKSPYPNVIAHIGKVSKGTIEEGMIISASIDKERRKKIQNNHTATHLLHWALHNVLGEHAHQAGSVVEVDKLRFDFSHHNQLSDEEIRKIEMLVNSKINASVPLKNYEISYEDAQKRTDIKQFFGEKYGKLVRVVDIEDFSKELCGGTHTPNTGNIGYFRISRESGIAAGVRRIEAVTGEKAESFAYHVDDLLKEISNRLKTPQHKLLERVDKLQEEIKTLHSDIKQLKKEKLHGIAKTLERSISPSNVPYVVAEVSLKQDEVKALSDELTLLMPSHVIALGAKDQDKAFIIIKVSTDLIEKKVNANDLLKQVIPLISGNGGGKSDFAQGAGPQKENLINALNKLTSLL